MRQEHLNLPVLVGLLWMASNSKGSDTVLLYPTIMMPRNITMGFGTFVNFRCELNITAGSASEVFWLLGGARILNDPRRHSRLEVPAEGRYISYLEVRDLQAADAGRYTCDATARLNNLNLVRVIPDSVYLSLADYRAAHWGEPCDSRGAGACVDANTGCFRDRPPQRITATGWSCQCIEGFPIHNPALRRCESGSFLGGPCIEDGQCRWFTQFSVCKRGVCECADAYTATRDGTECTQGSRLSMKRALLSHGEELVFPVHNKQSEYCNVTDDEASHQKWFLKAANAAWTGSVNRQAWNASTAAADTKSWSPEARPPSWPCFPSLPSAF